MPLSSKEIRPIAKGDVVSVRLSGAGGYGPPAERDRAAIAEDIADGYVTRDFAAAKYGYRD
jgi:N-methylhydantoinase B